MRFLADDSIHDNRPPKRRRIDLRAAEIDVLNTKRLSSLKSNSLRDQTCLTLCSICKQLSSRYFSCPSCQTVCCEGCSGYCDADMLGIQQPPTPPLLEDDDSAFGSTPSTPNRYSTPETFDPQLLRARLASAAGLPAAALTSTPVRSASPFYTTELQQPNQYQPPPSSQPHEPSSSSRQNPLYDLHHAGAHDGHHHLALGLMNSTTPLGGLPNISQQHIGTQPVQTHHQTGPTALFMALAGTCVQVKKRKRTSCGEGGINKAIDSSVIRNSTTASFNPGRPLSAVSRQQNQFMHCEARSCSMSTVNNPASSACCYHCLYENGHAPIAASLGDCGTASLDRDLQPQMGCTSRFCSNCLVQTADGYKICVPCLDECYPV